MGRADAGKQERPMGQKNKGGKLARRITRSKRKRWTRGLEEQCAEDADRRRVTVMKRRTGAAKRRTRRRDRIVAAMSPGGECIYSSLDNTIDRPPVKV